MHFYKRPYGTMTMTGWLANKHFCSLQWPMALEPVWNLLSAVHTGEDSDWDGLARWYTLPCSSGPEKAMVRLSHRGLVFCPRYESHQEAPAESTASPRSFPVAVEDSLSTQRSSSVIPELSVGEGGSAPGGDGEEGSAAPSSSPPDLASVQAAQLAARLSIPEQSTDTTRTEQAVQQLQQESSTPGADRAAQHAAGRSAGSQEEPDRSASEVVSNGSLSASVIETPPTVTHSVRSTEQSTPAPRPLGNTTGSHLCSSTQSASTAQTESAPQNGHPNAGDNSSIASTQALTRERLAKPWLGLLPFLEELGLPVLDRAYGHLAHVCALQQPTEQDSIVHKLLQCRNAGLLDVRCPISCSVDSPVP